MKVAIAGYGVEGKASYEYWKAKGAEVVIADERVHDDAPADAVTLFESNAFSQLHDFDLVVRTAGLAPNKIVTNGKIWSATNEFFQQCPAPIIGITGTKGKGTTASLIHSILVAAGKTVHLVGNIGVPALGQLAAIRDDDIVVYELSSFQLWDIQYSPQVAVVLPIEPDHLNVHADMDDYVSAKANIVKYQAADDMIVYNARNSIARHIAELSPARHRVQYPQPLDEDIVAALQLAGKHNLENLSAAVAAVQQYVTGSEVISRGVASFKGLPHRLKYVATRRGVTYYDDSISTTPGSAIAALHSFEKPKVLLLGGSSKGATYDGVIELCRQTGTRVIAFGQTGQNIVNLCRQANIACEYIDGYMEQVVEMASRLAAPGDIVILSPASASFDQYPNYSERGDRFIAAVQQLPE